VKSLLFALVLILSNSQVLAQGAGSEYDIEAELNSAQGQPEIPPPEIQPAEIPKPKSQKKTSRMSPVDEEIRTQERILKKKNQETQVSSDRNVDRYPKTEPYFEKPPGPKQGGVQRVEHPDAAKGLIRINKDGSYQYKTKIKEKSQSGAFKVGMMTPPKVQSANSAAITFESMYGSGSIFALEFDYTWQPFRKYGALGLKAGIGFATATADGYFKTARPGPDPASRTRSEETYNLFIVPMSAFLEYRFEYVRRQWAVPYIFGGGIYYGLAEIRNDGKTPDFAGAPAAGGGGGLLISISRMDAAGAFTLSEEYGIADMWLVLEAKAIQGLSKDTDFTNQTASAGIAVDF